MLSKQRRRDFEDLFVQRYWNIIDDLSLEALESVKPDGGVVTTRDKKTVIRFLMLSEDELDLRADRWISKKTWDLWRDGMATRPSATFFTLNRDHMAARPVIELAQLPITLAKRLAEFIQSWVIQPEHAYLFGSAARQDGDASSDVDVLLVHTNGRQEPCRGTPDPGPRDYPEDRSPSTIQPSPLNDSSPTRQANPQFGGQRRSLTG